MSDGFNPDSYLNATAPTEAATSESQFNPDDYLKEAEFGTTGQQLVTGLEGAAQGVVGPLAPLAEIKLGLTTPERIRARAEVNPDSHTASEIAGFVGSAATSLGVAPLLESVGKGVAKLLPKAAPRLAVTGIKTGAEMAALQSSDELSKMVTQDPNQSIESAATNIGLSGLIGIGGGAALGAVSPLWKTTAEKTGLSKIIDDTKAQYNFRQINPEPASTAVEELSNRMSAMDELRHSSGGLKGKAIAESLPESTPENIAKVDSQIQDLSDRIATRLEKASESVKTKSAVPYLAEDFTKFQEAVTNPESNFASKFNALDDLKKDFASYAKFAGTEEATAKGALGAELSAAIRPALEDSAVWGEAGNIQRKINSAISDSLRSQKDLLSKFTSKQLGEVIVDPNKVESYLNQARKSKASMKQSVLSNYLDSTQKLADTIRGIHESVGLEAPEAASINPTPVLNKSLEKTSAGTQLGDYLFDKGSSEAIGHGVAGAIGAGIGRVLGHPELGALAGERMLGPTFTSIAKPFMEKATHSEGAKSALNYISQIAKGQKLQSNAVKNMFKAGSLVIPQQLMPNEKSRKSLQTQLDHLSENPQKALDIGKNLQHYLPDHAQTAASLAATASTYLSNLKPKQVQVSVLDTPPPVSSVAKSNYERQLDIAQQPLITLQHLKDGTLLPQDITTIKTIYPNLYKSLVSQISQEIVTAKNNEVNIPYKTRLSLSAFMGQPLDSTMTQPSMLASMGANGGSKPQQPQPTKKPSKPSLAQQEKLNGMYATNSQKNESKNV